MRFLYWPMKLQKTNYSLEATDDPATERCKLTLKWNDGTADAVFIARSGSDLFDSKATFLSEIYSYDSQHQLKLISLRDVCQDKKASPNNASIGAAKDVETHVWLKYCESTFGNVVFKIPYRDGFEGDQEAEVTLPSGYGLTPKILARHFMGSLSDTDRNRIESNDVESKYFYRHKEVRQAYLNRCAQR